MKGGRLRLPVRMSSCHQKTSPQRGLEESPSPFGNAGFAEGDNHHFRADFADHPPIDRNLLPFFPKEGPAPRQNQGFHPSTEIGRASCRERVWTSLVDGAAEVNR